MIKIFSNQTYENILNRILANINNNLDKREGSVTYNLLAPLVEELAKAYIEMDDLLTLAFIQDSFFEYLDRRVNEFGVYRKEGTKATGSITITGEDDTVISNGSIVRCGSYEFVVLNDIVLPDDNIIYVEALEIGEDYNLLAGVSFTSDIKGIESMTNEEDFEGGTERETDEELKERFDFEISNPRTSGNANNYIEWALECDGIGNAKVYPLWDGNGTVKVLVVGNDNLPVEDELLEECRLHIEEMRPIGATVTVATPELLSLAFNIEVRIDDNYSLNEAKEQIESALSSCLEETEGDIIYAKFFSAVGDLDCVEDILIFTINSDTINIELDDYHVAVIDTTEISGVI